jgi:Hypoxia induced protein conserved region
MEAPFAKEVAMSTGTLFFLIAAMCLVAIALGGGILSMINGGRIGERSTTQWMALRVVSQAAAVVLLLIAVLSAN